MKPTPEISSNGRHSRRHDRTRGDHRSFPPTDYSYQTTGTAPAPPPPRRNRPETRTLRALGRAYDSESTRDYVIEAISFACISGVAAWPLAILLHELLTFMI